MSQPKKINLNVILVRNFHCKLGIKLDFQLNLIGQIYTNIIMKKIGFKITIFLQNKIINYAEIGTSLKQ